MAIETLPEPSIPITHAVPAAVRIPDRDADHRGGNASAWRWSSLMAIFAPWLAPHDPTNCWRRRSG